MTKPTTIRQFFEQFPDDDTCLKHLFDVRFGQGYCCPKCDREAKWYPIKAERAFSCQWCGHHIHPTVGTLFEQMSEIDGEDPLGGNGFDVEVDETYVGGKRPGKRGRGAAGKTIVFGMIERNGEVMVKVVPNVRRDTLHSIIEANVAKDTTIHADELLSYNGLDKKGYKQARVNHGKGQYVGPNGETVNAIENFWRHLKQGIKGTHIWVSPKYLETYAKEFEYRFNRRSCPEADEFLDVACFSGFLKRRHS